MRHAAQVEWPAPSHGLGLRFQGFLPLDSYEFLRIALSYIVSMDSYGSHYWLTGAIDSDEVTML